MQEVNTSTNPGSLAWKDFLAMGSRLENSPTPLQPTVYEKLETIFT